MTQSPLEALLARLGDDAALLKVGTLKTVMRAMLRQVPIPGRGLKGKELPDGLMLSFEGADAVSFPFRVAIVDNQVEVDPGFWDFAGQPTFPGWGGGDPFGVGTPPSLIPISGGERWRLYLRATHTTMGELTDEPVGVQSVEALSDTNTTTHILLAFGDRDGVFESVQQAAAGNIITGLSPFLDDLGAVVNVGRSHHSY